MCMAIIWVFTWCEELTHLKRPWCWERLRAGGEGDDRAWNGWMASPTQWTWVWVDSRSWWWTGRPGVLWFMGLQRVRHDWATELNWYFTVSVGRLLKLGQNPEATKEMIGKFDYVKKMLHGKNTVTKSKDSWETGRNYLWHTTKGCVSSMSKTLNTGE